MKVAIIDCGTNTFNLSIVEIINTSNFNVIVNTKKSVKLGEHSINKKVIGPVPFKRGIDTMKEYFDIINKHDVDKIYAFATSAFRSAKNGMELVDAIKNETGIEINIVSGEREADLIHKGVKLAYTMTCTPVLIMDIGGGSTEFIIADENKVIWKHSFNMGVARLLQKFNPSDPLKLSEKEALENYFFEEFTLLFDKIKEYKIKALIGCAGSFESIAEIICHKFYTPDLIKLTTSFPISFKDFKVVYEQLLASTEEERYKMKGLIPMRVDSIVYASIMINFIINKVKPDKLVVSFYALKEGALYEVLHNEI